MRESPARGGSGGIQSVERAFHVLDAFVVADRALRLTEIAKAAGITRHLAHAYVTSLVRVGAVVKDNSGAYRLGETVMHLGLAALARMDFLAISRDVMQQLQNEVDQSVWLSVWSEHGPVVVAKIDGRRPSPFEIRIGTRVELSVSSTGKTFLAHLDAAAWRDLVDLERRELGELAPGDEELERLLADVRRDGVATRPAIVVSRSVTLSQFSSVAAPVFDESGAVRAALTVIGQTGTFDVSADGHNAEAVRSAAARISGRLGYRIRSGA